MNRNIHNAVSLAIALSVAALAAHRLGAQQTPEDRGPSTPAQRTADDAAQERETVEARPSGEATTQPAGEELAPRRKVTSTDILRELQRDSQPARVVIPTDPRAAATREVVSADALPPHAIAPVNRKLLPDGSRIVDRPGRLTREGDGFVFTFEGRGQGEIEMPMRLLPNRLLEDMEIFSENGTLPVVFLVGGDVTEYHGSNYLLVQKLLTRTDMGNLR